jgi:hypothetical protein
MYVLDVEYTIHLQEENEDVVQMILSGFPDWDVVQPSCLATWHRRGLPTPVRSFPLEFYYSGILIYFV